MLMLMPMLMMLAPTLVLLLDVGAYAAANDAGADAKMPNAARHLVGAYAVLLLPSLLPMLMLLRQLL